MAVDRDDFVKQITGGFAEVADGIYAPGSPWYSPSSAPMWSA